LHAVPVEPQEALGRCAHDPERSCIDVGRERRRVQPRQAPEQIDRVIFERTLDPVGEVDLIDVPGGDIVEGARDASQVIGARCRERRLAAGRSGRRARGCGPPRALKRRPQALDPRPRPGPRGTSPRRADPGGDQDHAPRAESVLSNLTILTNLIYCETGVVDSRGNYRSFPSH